MICAWSLAVYAQVSVKKTTTGLEYDFEIEGFKVREEVVDKEKFQKITLQGVEDFAGVYHKKGEVELPVIRFFVNGPGEIQIVPTDNKEEGASPLVIRNFLRASDAVPKIPGVRKTVPRFVESSLSMDTDFDVVKVGSVRGVERRLVTLYPVHWNAKTGLVQKKSRFKVNVPHLESDGPSVEKMVIVVPERFAESEALEKLIEHKYALGMSIEKIILTTADKDPEFIRNELMKVYQANRESLKYVLLVGTARLLPGYVSERLKGITDHYYRCLDTKDYEADIGAPDVYLSRLSVKTEEDLSVQVQKIIDYESKREEEVWKKKASFITTNDKEHWQIAEDSSNYTIKKYTEIKGFQGSFPEEKSEGGDKLYAVTHKANGDHVVSAIREGRGFIQYSGHGLSNSWEYPRVTMGDIASIEENGAIPVVIANACDTAKITANDTIAETWMRNKFGSIFYWGAMDAAYWEEDVVLQKKLSDEIFGVGNIQTGAFTNNALSDVWRFYGGKGESKYYWELYLSLGDPSLKVSFK